MVRDVVSGKSPWTQAESTALLSKNIKTNITQQRKYCSVEAFHKNQQNVAKGGYGLKPEVWGRVVPDPRAELQVDPDRWPQAQ